MKTRSIVSTATLLATMLLCSALPASAQLRLPFPPFCGGPGQRSCIPFPLCGIGPFPACPAPACGVAGTPPCASTLLDTYYNVAANDNTVNLINPALSGIGNTCAMIYVFDDQEEMISCCGCALSPQKVSTLSVETKLLSNAVRASVSNPTSGVIDIVSAPPSRSGTCSPTNNPGYNPAPELKAYIQHYNGSPGVPEVSFADASDPTTTTLAYLQGECGALLGNGSGQGVCSCGN